MYGVVCRIVYVVSVCVFVLCGLCLFVYVLLSCVMRVSSVFCAHVCVVVLFVCVVFVLKCVVFVVVLCSVVWVGVFVLFCDVDCVLGGVGLCLCFCHFVLFCLVSWFLHVLCRGWWFVCKSRLWLCLRMC